MICLQFTAGNKLIIRNLEMQSDMKKFAMPANQTVVYWRWLNANTVAIVTDLSVYHWYEYLIKGCVLVSMFFTQFSLWVC